MPEEEAFCVLVQLMNSYKMRDVYKPSMADLSLCFYQLDKLIEVTYTAPSDTARQAHRGNMYSAFRYLQLDKLIEVTCIYSTFRYLQLV